MNINWRLIPHPSYGNYGGAWNTGRNGVDDPIDKMDSLFKDHDKNLKTYKLCKEVADEVLLNTIKTIKMKDLKYKLYGTFYKYSVILIFSLVLHINK